MDIHKAAQAGNLSRVKQCLKNGIDVDSLDHCGLTALYVAGLYNQIPVIRFLLENGANIEVRKPGTTYTLLTQATCKSDLSVMRELLDHGADVNSQDVTGNTALVHAIMWGQHRAVKVLIEAGADVNLSDKWGKSPLDTAAHCGQLEMIKTLVAAGANLESRTSVGDTPLISAARKDWPEVIALLCELGSDVNVRNESQCTALHFAVSNHNATVVKTLLAHGATLYKNTDGKTPLDHAKDRCLPEIVRLLENSVAECHSGSDNDVNVPSRMENAKDANTSQENLMGTVGANIKKRLQHSKPRRIQGKKKTKIPSQKERGPKFNFRSTRQRQGTFHYTK